LQAPFEHAHERRARPALHTNRRERIPWRIATIGPIENLPVTELAAATQPDRAGADAAERKRDLGQLRAGEDARIGDACA
jgi:hypothetical protein